MQKLLNRKLQLKKMMRWTSLLVISVRQLYDSIYESFQRKWHAESGIKRNTYPDKNREKCTANDMHNDAISILIGAREPTTTVVRERGGEGDRSKWDSLCQMQRRQMRALHGRPCLLSRLRWWLRSARCLAQDRTFCLHTNYGRHVFAWVTVLWKNPENCIRHSGGCCCRHYSCCCYSWLCCATAFLSNPLHSVLTLTIVVHFASDNLRKANKRTSRKNKSI